MKDPLNTLVLRPRPARPAFQLFAMVVFRFAILCLLLATSAASVRANVAGGILPGTNPAVTLTDNGSTVTISNGIVSVLCTKADATITEINYTYNNGNGSTTTQMLNGGTDGGELYWEYGGFGGSASTYTLVTNPATGDANHPAGTYAEIDLLSTSSTNGTVDVHFSMLQGSPGFYVTAIWSHRSTDVAMGLGETRTNIYAGSIFNWMSVDAFRNKLMEVSDTATTIPVPGAPVECYLWTNGIYQGLYEDKYKYSADFGNQRTWGWSSVGSGGHNIGIWDVNPTMEYYNCGPMKRELMSHIGTTILNMFNGDHYAEDMDASFAAGEAWTKVYGPYFVYCNNTPISTTNMVTASQALYSDALAQATAEAGAWPYSWFVNSNYASASQRGSVTGQIVISDSGNPNASGSNLWVGVELQPPTSASTYDFQAWMKAYEFWTQSDSNGNFTIPNVIAGSNYTLYAFGQGAESELMSQNQTGGNPPLLFNLPATPFGVTVTGGSTTNLGTVTWKPSRVGPTVFEIGYPDRTGRKFKHGDDFWVGDIGSSPTDPAPVWSKFLEFPFDFPSGPTYTVGQSQWPTSWNFIQPIEVDTAGADAATSSTIDFNLASTPITGGTASLYLGLASDYYGAPNVSVNGTNLGGAAGVTATPETFPSTGYVPPYTHEDSSIREGINGIFSDERINFPASLLHSGANTILLSLRQVGGAYFANHFMYDYVRLELTGYVPPPPASVAAFAGNNCALLSWPVTPGATSYNILRSTTNGSGYTSLVTGVLGPVCGSGPQNDTYLDTTASNGITYYYVVDSVNPIGASANSPQSPAVLPSSGAATSPPDAPTAVTPTPGNGQVALSWTAPANANYYVVQRSTLVANGGGTYNTLSTVTLSNTTTGTTYTDPTTTNGSTYSYIVSAVNASGTGTASTGTNAVPLGIAPTAAPTLNVTPGSGQVTMNWTSVPNAVGYVISYGTSATGPFTLVADQPQLTYTVTGLADGTTYYFVVAPMSSGGTGPNSNIASTTTALGPPTSLTATPGNTQVNLTWPAVSGATSYDVQRSTTNGGPYGAIGTAPGPVYTDHGLTDGTTYYYVVASTDAAGTGADSGQASATPSTSLPLAPTDLTASATNGEIALSWTAPVGATGYFVFRSTGDGGPYTEFPRAITTSTFGDNTVLDGPTYFYVVEAENGSGNSSYSNQASGSLVAPETLLWTGSSSSAWDFSTANWMSSGGSGGAATYFDGSNVIFPDGAANDTVSIAAAVSPDSVGFSNSSDTYTVNSSASGISGAATVAMAGSSEVMVTGPQSYTGGTTIDSGTYALGADSSTSATTVESPGLTGGTNASLGNSSAPILVNTGGQLRFGGVGGATVRTFFIVNPLTVNGGSVYGADGLQEFTGGVTIGDNGANFLPTWSGKNLRIQSTLSGSGDITIDNWDGPGDTAGGLVEVSSADNPYNGTITVNAPSTGFLGGVLELGTSNALINATIVDNNTSTNGLTFSGNTPQVGALAGPGNISLSSASRTLFAGYDGASTTYSGNLTGSGGFNKTGAGTMIASGALSYTGTTTVSGGILEITGSITASKSLTVSSGATLFINGGSTNINGSITNNGTVKLAGAALLTMTGTFTNNGVLDLIDGPQTLPANFINNGTVLYSTSVQGQQATFGGSSFSFTVQGYAEHTYQLQRATSLAAPITWTNVGVAVTGTGAPITFTDPSVSGTADFYKVLISP
jgi:autotransporter-associated beta strand protein